MLEKNSHIHLVGICGTAMASLAGLLKSLGYRVTGSDQNVYPPMSTQLKELNIPILEGYKKENLKPRPDLVVIGNVITRQNEEAQAVIDLKIPYTSLPKALGEFAIANRQSIVIAGTHGKTTTTAMMTMIATECGFEPGYLIGGIPIDFSHSFSQAKGNLFIIEGDEYDTAFFDKVPKFVHYRTQCAILTSIEFDHADIYEDLTAVKKAFYRLVEMIPKEGILVVNSDDEHAMEVAKRAQCRWVTYGWKSGDYRAVNRQVLHGRNQFAVEYKGQKVADLALKQFGPHNTLNALSAFALSRELRWPMHKILNALARFQGVKRRQELIGEKNGVKVIEDFAHHPTAVKLTIQSLRERFPGQRILAVFEPRSATSRRKVFQEDYAEALIQADLSIVAKPYDQSKIKEDDRFSTAELVMDLNQRGALSFEGENSSHIIEILNSHVREGDVILIMSNGGFDGIYEKLLQTL